MARKSVRKTVSAVLKAPPASTATVSLLSPTGMGGIVGADGYDYQKRWILCQIPRLLANVKFSQLLYEGCGDLDIHFGNSADGSREHVQVKNNCVLVGKFRDAVKTFAKFEMSMPGAFSKYTLIAPSFDSKVSSIASALRRVRGADSFFAEERPALATTMRDIAKKLKAAGLETLKDFVLKKVHIEKADCNLDKDESSQETFITRLRGLSTHSALSNEIIVQIYRALHELAVQHRGKALTRWAIENCVKKSSAAVQSVTVAAEVAVHNWVCEKYPTKPDFEIDWSHRFDRNSRRMPEADEWQELHPEFLKVRESLLKQTVRHVKFKGKCCLTTGIAFGAALPKTGGWLIELQQHPLPTSWRSDAVPDLKYNINCREERLNESGDSIVAAISVTGDGANEISAYVNAAGIRAKAIHFVSPQTQPGSMSITSDSEAISFAMKARDHLKGALSNHGLSRSHVFYYGPFALGIFLGQWLTSLGEIQLYEYTNPGYVPTVLLRT